MFVVDKNLKTLIADGIVKLRVNNHFLTVNDLGDRIRPCSINLRLSNKFWIPRKRKMVNLGNSFHIKQIQSILWKERYLKPREYILLKPGDIIFARTEEYIYIPKNFAAILQTKSSFLRLGIDASIQRFGNPGWEGHWPLQICNNGKFKVKIFPDSDIVQIIYIELDSPVEHDYSTGLYQFDDGGPSKWWLDQSIKNVCQNITGDYQSIFDDIVLSVPADYQLQVAVRLAKFIKKNSFSPTSLKSQFIGNERKKKRLIDFYKNLCKVPPIAGAIIDIFALFLQLIYFKAFITIIIICILYLFFIYRVYTYLSSRWYYTV